MLPEALEGEKYDPKQGDLFASAIVLFTMMLGHRPFGIASKRDKLYKLIIKENWELFWDIHLKYNKSRVTKSFKDLFQKMVSNNSEKRITLVQIQQHEWLNPKKHSSDTQVGRFSDLFVKIPPLISKQSVEAENDSESEDSDDSMTFMPAQDEGVLKAIPSLTTNCSGLDYI